MKTLTNTEWMQIGGTPGKYEKVVSRICMLMGDDNSRSREIAEGILNQLGTKHFSTWRSGNFRCLNHEGWWLVNHFLFEQEECPDDAYDIQAALNVRQMGEALDDSSETSEHQKEQERKIFTEKVDCFQWGVAVGCILTGAISYLWFII